jgi:predicted ferric reductase
VTPVAIAATSPLLAWRTGIYIAASFAGIVALALLLLQPLLARGLLPGLSGHSGRRIHRFVGGTLVIAVLAHVAGLWLTSAPDVIDALLFQSPTPFSAWGVITMAAVILSASLAILRHRLGLGPQTWRIAHLSLAIVIVAGSILHAILVEGAMGYFSKALICVLIIAATTKAVADSQIWTTLQRGRKKIGNADKS